jgi:hypothetical protein
MAIEEKIIPEFLDDEMRKWLEWGRSHPEEMKKDKCPFGFMDIEWHYWQRVKYAEKLAGMDVAAQQKEFKMNQHMAKKMSS